MLSFQGREKNLSSALAKNEAKRQQMTHFVDSQDPLPVIQLYANPYSEYAQSLLLKSTRAHANKQSREGNTNNLSQEGNK